MEALARRLLKELYNVTDTTVISSGNVKFNAFFKMNDDTYILSVSPNKKVISSVEKWLIIPYEKGVYENYYYEIRKKIEGIHPDYFNETIFKVMKKIHLTPQVSEGYGWLNELGKGQFNNIYDFVESFFSKNQTGYWKDWYQLFDEMLEKEFFMMTYDIMIRLLKYSDGKKYLVHGDFHLKNVLLHENVIRVIDWDNVMIMDYVYDIASISYDTEMVIEWAKKSYEDLEYFEERLLCMQLIRGLDALRFFAKHERYDSYLGTKRYMEKCMND